MSKFNKWLQIKNRDFYVYILDIKSDNGIFPYAHWKKSQREFVFNSMGIGDLENFNTQEVDPNLTTLEKCCMIANILGDYQRIIKY